MPANLPRLGLVLCLLALGAGCGGDDNSGPPEPDNVTLHIAGMVTDQENEVPLSGVTIGLWDILGADKPVVKTTTDAAGHYQLSTLVESCANGNTTLVFDAITANNCYYMDAADSPACTEARQTFDFPLLRHQGVEGCPWTSGLLQISPPR